MGSKEDRVLKKWYFWTVLLEKTPESPLEIKEYKPVTLKGNQSWILIGRTDSEAEAPILWPHDVQNWLIRKDLDLGKDWRQEEKGTTEDEMVGWHHRLDGQEFEQAPGAGDGRGNLVCCSSWNHKESDTTEWLNNKNAAWPVLVPRPGIELAPSALEGRFLTTRLPGKSPFTTFISYFLLMQVKKTTKDF